MPFISDPALNLTYCYLSDENYNININYNKQPALNNQNDINWEQICAEAEHPYYSDFALTATRESHSTLWIQYIYWA